MIPYLVERKGKTVYLLKQGAKPVPERRKRRKIDIFELPTQGNPDKGEAKQEHPSLQAPLGDFKDITGTPMMSRRSKKPGTD